MPPNPDLSQVRQKFPSPPPTYTDKTYPSKATNNLGLQFLFSSRQREDSDLPLCFPGRIAEKEAFFSLFPPPFSPLLSKPESLVRDLSTRRPRLLFICFALITKLLVSLVCKPGYAAVQATQRSIHGLENALWWWKAEKQNKPHLTQQICVPNTCWQHLKSKYKWRRDFFYSWGCGEPWEKAGIGGWSAGNPIIWWGMSLILVLRVFAVPCSLQGRKKKVLKPCYFTEKFCELRMLPAHSHLLPDGQDTFPSGMRNWLIFVIFFFPSTHRVGMGLDPTLCSGVRKQRVQTLEEDFNVSCALRSWRKRFGALRWENYILSKAVSSFCHPEWSL